MNPSPSSRPDTPCGNHRLRQDLLREGHLAGPNRELPRVLPVVVHTGRERWCAPLSVQA